VKISGVLFASPISSVATATRYRRSHIIEKSKHNQQASASAAAAARRPTPTETHQSSRTHAAVCAACYFLEVLKIPEFILINPGIVIVIVVATTHYFNAAKSSEGCNVSGL